jgi:hypothetical protein
MYCVLFLVARRNELRLLAHGWLLELDPGAFVSVPSVGISDAYRFSAAQFMQVIVVTQHEECVSATDYLQESGPYYVCDLKISKVDDAVV